MPATHHARLIRSADVNATPVSGAGEIRDRYFEQFGIDDARSLVTVAHTRPMDAMVATIIVRLEAITLEAQNALLKVLEEPPESTRFIFVVPADLSLLPTLLSRFEAVAPPEAASADTVFAEFLATPLKERLATIERATKSKDLEWQRSFKRGLIEHVRATPLDLSGDIEFACRWLLTRGASNKMLLEQVALSLPTRPVRRK